MKEIQTASLVELAEGLRENRWTSEELVGAYIERIDRLDGTLNAYLSHRFEKALLEAKESDERRRGGVSLSAFDGVPIALKDNFALAGERMTAASRMLENYVAPYDSEVVVRLKRAGFVILGKLNMDEFAMGASNETSAFGLCRNPWNLNHSPGGSSGGSAVAVAASLAPIALGSDTGGSVRQPAAFCGVSGLLPTYGRISRYGMVAFASSLDQPGLVARDVVSLAHLFDLLAGYDPHDPTSLNLESPKFSQLFKNYSFADLRNLTIGISEDYVSSILDDDIGEAFEAAVAFFRDRGARIVHHSLSHLEHAIGVYHVISTAEASSNLARFDGIRYGYHPSEGKGLSLEDFYAKVRGEAFGREVKKRLLLGHYVLSEEHYEDYYVQAKKLRRLIREDFQRAFECCDLFMTPTTATLPPTLGRDSRPLLKLFRADILTAPSNLAGLPSLSIPAGWSASHLPIGLQFIAPPLREDRLFQAAYLFQLATDYHLQRPFE